MAYSKILRRLREEKTNYKRRSAMLNGKRDFVTVKISNENTHVQIHKPELRGDKVIASAHSRFLLKQGWNGSRKNIPAAYLTGYLAGKKAIVKGGKDAILYRGTDRYTTRMAAALKGVLDAGLKIPAKAESFPPEERIKGEHLKVKNDVDKVKSSIDNEVKSA
jgi:large subunit ribosomal protein L18